MPEQTLGEKRVRIQFNPGNNDIVSQIKQKTAELINLCEGLKDAPSLGNEKNRTLAVAQTEYESAAMWAVKGATF